MTEAEMPGLTGNIIRDRSGEVGSAVAQGGLAVLGGLANTLPLGGDPLSAGIDETTDEMLDNDRRYAPEAASAVIEVPAQKFYIQLAAGL